MTENSNKAIGLRAQRELLVDHDISALDRYFGDEYIQHNAMLPAGVAAIRQFFTQVLPMSRIEILRVLGDGDFVGFHQKVELGGDTMIAFDIYRMANGKFVEHWDAVQPVSEPENVNIFNGPAEAAGETETTRAIVTAFIDSVIVKGDLSAIETYVASDIDRHGLGTGISSLRNSLEQRSHPARRCHRLLAEGGFALSVSEQQ